VREKYCSFAEKYWSSGEEQGSHICKTKDFTLSVIFSC